MSSYTDTEMHKHPGQEARDEFDTSLLCLTRPGMHCGAHAYLARSSQSERWLDLRVPDPTYPLRPFLCGGGMAEKKGMKPKLVTLALRGVSTLEFRKENSRSPSEEKMKRTIWN